MVNSILNEFVLRLNFIMYVFMYDKSTGDFSKLFFCHNDQMRIILQVKIVPHTCGFLLLATRGQHNKQ